MSGSSGQSGISLTEPVASGATAKDSTAMDAWKAKKVAEWEAGGKLKTKYPTRELLNAWMIKQCEKALAKKQEVCSRKRATYFEENFINIFRGYFLGRKEDRSTRFAQTCL